MKLFTRKLLLPVLFLLVCVGCGRWFWLGTGAAAGTGTVLYFKGRIREVISQPVRKVHEAAQAALKENGLSVISDSSELAIHVIMRTEYADGKNVRIDIVPLGDSVSELTIRVGVADQTRARMILSAIKEKLG